MHYTPSQDSAGSSPVPNFAMNVNGNSMFGGAPQPRRRKTKGWDGEIPIPPSPSVGGPLGGGAVGEIDGQLLPAEDEQDGPIDLHAMKQLETSANADGSATTHVIVKCSLRDLARATNLRVEDAAFALNECGLLIRRELQENQGAMEGEEEMETVVISREMVEVVVRRRGLKRQCMDLAHVLL